MVDARNSFQRQTTLPGTMPLIKGCMEHGVDTWANVPKVQYVGDGPNEMIHLPRRNDDTVGGTSSARDFPSTCNAL